MNKIAFLVALVFVFASCSQKEEPHADWEESHPEPTAFKEDKGEITFEGTTTIQRESEDNGEITFEGTTTIQREGIANLNENQKTKEYNNLRQAIHQELNPSDGIEEGIKETIKRRAFEERYPELDYNETFGNKIGRDDLKPSVGPKTISGRDAEQ